MTKKHTKKYGTIKVAKNNPRPHDLPLVLTFSNEQTFYDTMHELNTRIRNGAPYHVTDSFWGLSMYQDKDAALGIVDIFCGQ